MVAAIRLLPLAELPMAVQALLTLALVVPLGPQIYRLVFQPIASASSLVLLIVSIAVHVAMVGIALLLFGPEGARTAPFSEAGLELGPVTFNSQTLWVIAVSLGLIIGLFLFFERSLYGKALRATAVNRMGARLMASRRAWRARPPSSSPPSSARCRASSSRPSPLYFDSGFIISLKGFVGAIIGGLASYQCALGRALGGADRSLLCSGPAQGDHRL